MSDLLFPSDARQKPSRYPIVALAVFLALSLAGLRVKHEGWQGADDRFHVAADRWDLGAPLPWWSWTKVTTTGDAPPMRELPEGLEYLPGPRIDPLGLALALVCSAGLGWILAAGWPRWRGALTRRDSLPARGPLVFAAMLGALLRVLVEASHPTWLGWVYALLALPMLAVTLCWRRPKLWLAAVYLATGMAGMEIAHMGFEGRPLIDRVLDPKQDFLPQLCFYFVDLLIVAIVLGVIRSVRARTAPIAK